MSQHVYLDTNAFRFFGIAFQDVTLSEDLRDKILISPLSAFEVFAQLANEDEGEAVLRQIHAVRNWTNSQHCGLLPWPDDMLHQLWFRRPIQDEEFTKRMTLSFNACLAASSVCELKVESTKFQQVMDDFKQGIAQNFKNMVDAARSDKKKTYDMTKDWFLGIAKRVHAEPDSRPVTDIVSALSAYHEFEESKLQTALANPAYNPLSNTNQNDVIDSEQLVYLGDESLRIITADKGIGRKVKKSKQAARIVIASPGDLMDACKAEAVLRGSLSA
jgi:hypothetical protein